MDFEEWYREAKKTNDCGFTAKDFFEAGQKSKQAEIDALKAEIKRAVLSLRNEFNLWSDDNEQFHAIEAQIEQLEELPK